MKTRRYTQALTLLLMLLCLSGCRCYNSDVETYCPILHPLTDTDEIYDISKYIREIYFEKMPDNILFSDINKLLINSRGDLILHDMKGQMLFYALNSDSLSIIANRGRAKNEYVASYDIAVRDGELLLLDDQCVRSFDLYSRGRDAVITPINKPYDAIAPCGKDNLYLFSGYSMNPRDNKKTNESLLYLLSDKGRMLNEYIQREDCTFTISNISQSCGNRYYLRPQNSTHIFYELTENSVRPAFRLDFGSKNIPKRYFYYDAGEDIGKYMNAPYYKLPMDMHHTSTHMYFHCCGPGATDVNFIYDYKGNGIRWQNGMSDSNLKILASDDKYFYMVYNNSGINKTGKGPLATYLETLCFDKFNDNASNVWLVKFSFTEL